MTSDVFPPDTKPVIMSAAQVAHQLRFAADRVEQGDSMEGSLSWAWADYPGEYYVGGVVRFDNNLGQGSIRVLWNT